MAGNKNNTKKANGQNKNKNNKPNGGKSSKSKPRSGITPSVKLGNGQSKVQWGNDRCVISGEDFVHTLELNPTPNSRNFAGAVLFPQYVNPWRIPGSRLTQFANLFQRFKFKRFTIRYIPAVPATVAGQIIMCTDTDATWAPVGDTQDVVRMMMAHKDRIMFHVFDNARACIPGTSKPEYMCDAQGQDIRVNNQGVFWAVLVTPVIKQDGGDWTNAVGSFVLDWEIEFRAARILAPQRITSNSATYGDWTGDDPTYGPSLVLGGGGAPPTQVVVAIFRDVGGAVGITTGVPYFLGRRFLEGTTPNDAVFVWNVYGSLRGAQQLDVTDLMVIEGPSLVTTEFVWWPIGPESGVRNAKENAKVTMNGTSPASSLGVVNVSYNNTDPRRQATEYLVRATGALPEGSNDVDGVSLIYEDAAGDTQTIGENDTLILRATTPNAIMTAAGWSEQQFVNVYGFNPDSTRIIGFLITAAGFMVRAISILASLTRISLAIVREIQENEQQFFGRVQFNLAHEIDRANGVHSGHTMTLIRNAPRTFPAGGVTSTTVRKQ